MEVPTVTALARNRTGGTLAAGEIGRFNTLFTDGTNVPPTYDYTLVSTKEGDVDGMWSELYLHPAATHDSATICAVAAESIADDAVGLVYLQGVVDAIVDHVGVIAVATGLCNLNTNGYLSLGAAGNRCHALLLEATPGTTTQTSRKVLFNGVNGFGRVL